MTDRHSAIREGAVAVITGGASGIGLAAATKLASLGLRVCIADLDRGEGRLARAGDTIAKAAGGDGNVMVHETDVSKSPALATLEKAVNDRFDLGDRGIDILMNNASIGPGSACLSASESWERTLAVNLWGVIHGTHVFAPKMIAGNKTVARLVINTGSKQGITTPPGNPAYNVSKAGVKSFTEALEHELRNTEGCLVRAHLLIPGFVFTEMAGQGKREKPPSAWTAEQTVDFLLASLAKNDFYILCPDNDVPRSLDERRILRAAGDVVENRPPLSRWHPDFADAFKAFVARKS